MEQKIFVNDGKPIFGGRAVKTNWNRRSIVALVAALVMTLSPSLSMAAVNQGTGDIAGVPGDLNNSNLFNLTATTLGLVKTAFLTDGTQLSDGDNVPSGTLVQFLIYMDNTTPVPITDLNVADLLAGAFTYQAGTIHVDNSVATGATAAAIWAAIDLTGALDDAEDGVDVAGISGATISAGSSAGNVQVDPLASFVWAIRFTVQM